jgi:flagellar biosynthesis/type III secretory pathway M-ring protein FliF/YscJ
MKEGFVILIIIALLFAGMYVFAMFSVFLEKLKRKRERKEELRQEELRLEEKSRKQEIRDEKAKQIHARREEMKAQLRRLEEIKQDLIRKGKIQPDIKQYCFMAFAIHNHINYIIFNPYNH